MGPGGVPAAGGGDVAVPVRAHGKPFGVATAFPTLGGLTRGARPEPRRLTSVARCATPRRASRLRRAGLVRDASIEDLGQTLERGRAARPFVERRSRALCHRDLRSIAARILPGAHRPRATPTRIAPAQYGVSRPDAPDARLVTYGAMLGLQLRRSENPLAGRVPHKFGSDLLHKVVCQRALPPRRAQSAPEHKAVAGRTASPAPTRFPERFPRRLASESTHRSTALFHPLTGRGAQRSTC